MNKIVEEAICKIIQGNQRQKHRKRVFLCEELSEQHSWALGVIAYDFAY